MSNTTVKVILFSRDLITSILGPAFLAHQNLELYLIVIKHSVSRGDTIAVFVGNIITCITGVVFA